MLGDLRAGDAAAAPARTRLADLGGALDLAVLAG
jgi:hypothetical protein